MVSTTVVFRHLRDHGTSIRTKPRKGWYIKRGWMMEWNPSHPRATADGYVKRMYRVWWEGRGILPKGLVLHHMNGNKQDDRVENLLPVDCREHARLHYATQPRAYVPRGGSRFAVAT